MPWMNMLYKTYEANAAMAGKAGESVPLSLVAHITANAQIEIYLNSAGEFQGAREVGLKERKTIIPVTETSASRTSGTVPHPLSDNLPYIASDFGKYLKSEKEAAKAEEKFTKYYEALERWATSSYTHPKVQAIFSYISKGTVTQDLIAAGRIDCNEEGKLTNGKVSGATYDKAMVRFRIMDDAANATWEDSTLFSCYTDYYLSNQSGEKDICYITGEMAPVSGNHPKGIVAAKYGAKLISSNDKSNFTYRGRFQTAEEACAISYEATQKAHSALTWLAERQGIAVGKKDKRTYIYWNPKGKEVLNSLIDICDTDRGKEEPVARTEEEFQKRLSDTLAGYRNKLDDNDDIVVIALDAATTGRLAVTYYNELKSSDFYDRLALWSRTCCWQLDCSKAGLKPDYMVTTPFTYQIISCAFGIPREGLLVTDDDVMKQQSQRIYHCILDKAPVPRDITQALFRQASNLQLFSLDLRKKILFVACAMIAKRYYDENNPQNSDNKNVGKEEKRIMANLDCNCKDRSYLFGRLLAVIETIESDYLKGANDNRETNAMRLQIAYSNHPLATYKMLNNKLEPYLRRMRPTKKRDEYRDLMDEIINDLGIKEIVDPKELKNINLPLNEWYLIGYHCQRRELFEKSENEKNKAKKNNVEENEI